MYPSIVPSTFIHPAHFVRRLSGDRMQSVVNQFADGNTQTIITSRDSIGKSYDFFYNNLNHVNTAKIMRFYNDLKGEANSFIFDPRFLDYTGRWRFSNEPRITAKISTNRRGIYDIELTVVKVSN